MEKICEICGAKYQKRYTEAKWRWEKRRFCSSVCGNKGKDSSHLKKYSLKKGNRIGEKTRFKKGHTPWVKGRKDWMSEEGKKARAESVRKMIQSESPEQRKSRMDKVLASRERNGIWQPPGQGKTGELAHNWKGMKATYQSRHSWIQRHFPRDGVCEACAEKKPPTHPSHTFGTDMANISGEYMRELTDWVELCRMCHRRFDMAQRFSKERGSITNFNGIPKQKPLLSNCN